MRKKRGSSGIAVLPARFGGENQPLWVKIPYRNRPGQGYTLQTQQRPFDYYVLWALVVILLAFNASLIYIAFIAEQRVATALVQVETYRQKLETMFGDAGTIIEDVRGGSIDYVVKLDQNIPITADVPLDFDAKVPMNMSIPFNTSVSGTFNGVTVSFPVHANIPVNMTVDVPIKTTIPISTTVPVKIDVPIHINIADTSFAKNLSDVQALVDKLNSLVSGFSLDILPKP